ncbi:YjcZ family sporulation protein [Paenibacillus sp. LMG 31460]|uniref:YjcZ family sporulation protein n=1 Tax=Paenibacillus germinis TaxID=2654979 RepID=A0ABX1YX36_9BACL|nr:YjcZ family sporulation protein [Paenibacillus germinis]NOU85693.1 YjcZ family sporulation protein [Paenibacillus germinis]
MGAVGYGEGYGRSSAFVLVLFILLVIITSAFVI